MKYKFTKVEDAQRPLVDNFKSLLTTGQDVNGEFVSVEDALTVTSGTAIRRAVEEVLLAPVQPRLIGHRLVRTTFMNTPGRSVVVRTLGALSNFDFFVGESGEYQEISASKGVGSLIELRFAKYGCIFKVSEELLEASNWEMITHQIQEVINAMDRYRDKAIMDMLFTRGVTVFDNTNPAQALVGRTEGRDIHGVGNGSMTYNDLLTMYSTISSYGYTPDVLILHPLQWAMFARDPILRDSGLVKGNVQEWLSSAEYPHRPYDVLGTVTGTGARGELNAKERDILSQGTAKLPSYSPFGGLTVLTSPLVPHDPVARTSTIIMADSQHTGILAFSEYLTLDEWDDKRNDMKTFKFREKWSLEVIDNGHAIAVAKNISNDPNEVFVNPIVVLDNVAPIARK